MSGAARRAQSEAFDLHVVPHVEVLYRVALSLTGQPADAEDLVQDTLVRAYRAVERFDGAHPRAWLLTILRNTHVNRNRRRRPVLLRVTDVPGLYFLRLPWQHTPGFAPVRLRPGRRAAFSTYLCARLRPR